MSSPLARSARSAGLVLALLLVLGAAVAIVGVGSDPEPVATTGSAGGSDVQPATEAGDLLAGMTQLGPEAASKSTSAPAAPAPDVSSQTPASPPVGPSGLGGAPLPEAVTAGTARVVKTAVLTLGVKKGRLDDAYRDALDGLARAGGWVQSSETGRDQATLVLKVPSERLDGVLDGLRRLGTVRSETIAGEDVSAEYVDLEARLTHWRAQESVFLGLMAKAQTIPETIQIQQQLSVIQEQIEQLEGRRRYLEGQTAFSTVRLSLLEAGAVAKRPEEAPTSTLARAWERAAGAALAVIGGTLFVLGVLLPLALVLGVPALALVALRRRQARGQAPVGAVAS
jgi:hypothetical protein